MLENWSAYYPENQIFVGFLEDILSSPKSCCSVSTSSWVWTLPRSTGL